MYSSHPRLEERLNEVWLELQRIYRERYGENLSGMDLDLLCVTRLERLVDRMTLRNDLENMVEPECEEVSTDEEEAEKILRQERYEHLHKIIQERKRGKNSEKKG